jgi:hypothetical protein
MECKYWLDRKAFNIEEALSYNMSEKDKRQIRKIIYDHFEYIELQWDDYSEEAPAMNKYHDIGEIKFCENLLETTIDGVKRRFQLKNISSLLEKASEIERKTFEISSSGYGIHWPLLDEDISIDGLLGIVNVPIKKSA